MARDAGAELLVVASCAHRRIARRLYGDDAQVALPDRLRALTGFEGRVLVGPPAEELLAFGDDVGLLVVGSRGHGPLRRLLLGSTSAYLARWARCPLLVLPGVGAQA